MRDFKESGGGVQIPVQDREQDIQKMHQVAKNFVYIAKVAAAVTVDVVAVAVVYYLCSLLNKGTLTLSPVLGAR